MTKMIPAIRDLYLRLSSEFYSRRLDSTNPPIWEFSLEQIEYLEQIQSIDDLMNYAPSQDGSGAIEALAYDCAMAMDLPKHDAMSVAGDI